MRTHARPIFRNTRAASSVLCKFISLTHNSVNVLTIIAGRNVAQPLFQTLGFAAKARRIRIIHVGVERIFGQLKEVRFESVQLAGMIEPNGQCATESFAIHTELFVFRNVLRENGSVVSTAQRIANGVSKIKNYNKKNYIGKYLLKHTFLFVDALRCSPNT